MSKLYSMYKNLKEKNSKKIYLFKSGIFYIALNNDAEILSTNFGFKITNLNDTVIKCGFPITSVDKYMKMFKYNNIDFDIIDPNSNTIFTPANYTINKSFIELLDSILSVDTDRLSVSESYKFIENLQAKSKEIKNLL